MLRVTLGLGCVALILGGPVDFDCNIIKSSTNEPQILKDIKRAVSKEMRFGKV